MARKKRRKVLKGRVTVSRDALNKLEHLGATHKKTLAQLKRSVRPVKARKKAKKKTSRRRKTTRRR